MFTISWYALAFLINAVVLSFLSISITSKLERPGGKATFVVLILIVVWSISSFISMIVDSLEVKVWFAKFWFTTGSFIPVVFLGLTLQYTYNTTRIFKPIFILIAIQLIIGLLSAYNELHGLTWSNLEVAPGGHLFFERGPLLNINRIYSHLISIIAIGLWIRLFAQSKGRPRLQAGLILASFFVSSISSTIFAYLGPSSDFPDLTPIGLGIGSILIIINIQYLRIFQWAPLARDQLVEVIENGYIYIDTYGYVYDANKVALELLGLDEVPYLTNIESLPIKNKHLSESLKRFGTTPYQWKDNNKRVWEAHITKIKAKNGTHLGYLHLWYDISRVIRYMSILEKEKEQIETLLTEREWILQILSHDLSNSFGSLEMNIDIIKESLGPENDEIINILEHTAHSASQLLKQVKDVLVIGANNLILQSVELKKAIEEALELVKYRDVSKQIHWEVNGSDDTFILSEPYFLVQSVLVNIFTNAFKFSMPNSSVDISWRVLGDTVELRIQDRGIGMDEELLKTLFSFTNKISRKGTKNEQGTGFGMAIVAKFMDLFRGSITCESRPGKGSTFILCFQKYISVDTYLQSSEEFLNEK